MVRYKEWEELTLQDNFLFQKVMQNPRICKHLIEKILNITIEKITYPESEKTIDIRLDSKSVRLDVYVQDDTGRVFDIEMQVSAGKDGELAKRSRYYQGMIDMEVLEKGGLYEDLNPTYIIFICTFDLFGKGLPKYTFCNQCEEDGTIALGDETTKVFLNSKGRTEGIDPDIAAFLQYIDGKDAEGVFMKDVDAEVQRVKRHDETRREYMTLKQEFERIARVNRAEGWEEGKAEGVEQNRLATALAMLGDGLPVDVITKYTTFSAEYLAKLAKEHHIV